MQATLRTSQAATGARCRPCVHQLAVHGTRTLSVSARSAATPRINAAAVLAPETALLDVMITPCPVRPSHSAGTVTELNTENFASFIDEAATAGEPVVVDFFTTWCGPCKIIAPEIVRMSAEYPGVRFAKFDCGANDKRFVKDLGIKALPTFYLFKEGTKVDQFVGAKAKELRRFVDKHVPPPAGL